MNLSPRRPLLALAAGFLFAVAPAARAHCDTLDGPVVKAARTALEKRDVTPVLRWVRAEDEPVIRDAFERTLKARALGPAARDVADRWFFETLVRIHRAGEGEPFDGLKPAGDSEPGIAEAEAALASGDPAGLAAGVAGAVEKGIRARHARVVALKAHAEESVEAGRAYVAAYVDYLHFVAAARALERAPHHPEEAAGPRDGH